MSFVEAGAVIGAVGEVLHWHCPPDRTVASLPDSPDLWALLWEHRGQLLGVAHTHPGRGIPGPSWEDLTTFEAVEAGLGKRLLWWIANADGMILLRWAGPDRYAYSTARLVVEPDWTAELRQRSAQVIERQTA